MSCTLNHRPSSSELYLEQQALKLWGGATAEPLLGNITLFTNVQSCTLKIMHSSSGVATAEPLLGNTTFQTNALSCTLKNGHSSSGAATAEPLLGKTTRK